MVNALDGAKVLVLRFWVLVAVLAAIAGGFE
jgi:hypothetical protein